jgi:hypothetical protein
MLPRPEQLQAVSALAALRWAWWRVLCRALAGWAFDAAIRPATAGGAI